METIDETHFIIDMDNGRTLNTRGEQNTRYADVASGTTGMIMIVQVTVGEFCKSRCAMMIFSNIDSSCPIRGVADSFAGMISHLIFDFFVFRP